MTKLWIGALIASVGYVARTFVHEWMNWRRRRQTKHARLLQRWCPRFCVNASRVDSRLGLSGRRQPSLAHPAGAARRKSILPERRGVRKGAPVLRGAANPCARAPFWYLPTLSTGGPAGERLHPAGVLRAGFDFFGLGFYCLTPASRMRSPHIVSR